MLLIISFIGKGQNMFQKSYWFNGALNAGHPTNDGGFVMTGYHLWGQYLGDREVLLVKVKSNGDTSFAKTYNLSNSSEGYNVWQTSDGGYIISGWSDNGVSYSYSNIIKTDSLGNGMWGIESGPSTNGAGGVAAFHQTNDGGFVIGFNEYN